jgi:small subunit ribosomal protein S20
MANIKSAKKRIRQIEQHTLQNRMRLGRIRTFIKKFEEALGTDKKKEALEAFRSMESEIMRGVSKGIIKRNTAARRVSRLAVRLNAL